MSSIDPALMILCLTCFDGRRPGVLVRPDDSVQGGGTVLFARNDLGLVS